MNALQAGSSSIFLLGGNRDRIDEPAYRRVMSEFMHEGDFLSPEQDVCALACYDRDSQHMHTMRPLLVFRPYSLTIIPSLIQTCASLSIPLTSRCGGTGRSGGSIASQGGLVLLTGHFRTILDYDKTNGIIRIEPGVTTRKINHHVCEQGWVLPLEMDTAGVAGLAGCLSSAAKGYHQAHMPLVHAVTSVTFIDGKGEKHQVPGSFLYGSEGIFGVITEMTLQLSRLPQIRSVLRFECEWNEMVQNLTFFQRFSPLVSLTWHRLNQVYVIIEGEKWRVEQSVNEIIEQYRAIEIHSDWVLSMRYPSNHSSFILSQFLPISAVRDGLSYLEELCSKLFLAYEVWYNALDESLHLSIFNKEEPYAFSKIVEQFLSLWVHFLGEHRGALMSRHGMGSFLSHDVLSFIKEEDRYFLQCLQKAFDPHQLFSHQHFFPL